MADEQQISSQQALNAAFFAPEAVAQPIETPVIEEQPIQPEPATAVEQQQPQESPIELPKPDVTPAFDPIAYLKENFGDQYSDIEVIKQKLNAPIPEPIYKEPEYINEESKHIAALIAAGKTKEVRQILQEQEFYSSVNEMKDDDVIKEYWKREIGLSQAQADKKFEKEFSVKDADLLDDDEKEIEEKFLTKKQQATASQFRTELSQKAVEIKLPSIEQPAQASAIQQDTSEEAKRADAYASELTRSLPKDVYSIGYNFKDDNSGTALEGQVTIPKEDVEKMKSQLSGYEDKVLAKRWFNPDGSAKEDLIARDLCLLTNPEKYMNAGVSDVYHKMKIGQIAENRNHQNSGKVIAGNFEPSAQEAAIAEFDQVWGVPKR